MTGQEVATSISSRKSAGRVCVAAGVAGLSDLLHPCCQRTTTRSRSVIFDNLNAKKRAIACCNLSVLLMKQPSAPVAAAGHIGEVVARFLSAK